MYIEIINNIVNQSKIRQLTHCLKPNKLSY